MDSFLSTSCCTPAPKRTEKRHNATKLSSATTPCSGTSTYAPMRTRPRFLQPGSLYPSKKDIQGPRGDSNHNVTESPSGTSLELPQNLIVSEGTTPPNFQEFSLQSLQFPDKFRKNIESSVILIFSYLCTEARRTILNGHVGGFVLCDKYARCLSAFGRALEGPANVDTQDLVMHLISLDSLFFPWFPTP